VSHSWTAVKVGISAAALIVVCSACKSEPLDRPIKTTPVNTGAGSIEATRRMLEGTWTLASFEAVDTAGARRPVKASGTLTYDAYGNMTIVGVIEDELVKGKVVLDYKGKIIIDPGTKRFYPSDLESSRPVSGGQFPIGTLDKVRSYELSPGSFVVTYTDDMGKPTAVARWRR
jgi:hypothetical protein